MFLIQRNISRCGRQLRTIANTSISSSKNDRSSSDDDNQSKKDTINRLNELLKIMVQEDSSKVQTASQSLELAKPKPKLAVRKEKPKGLGDKLKDAAMDVAQTLGGDSAKTEAELLGKFLGQSAESSSLSDLLSGMKVEKTPPADVNRAQQVRDSLHRGSTRQSDRMHQHTSYSEQIKSEVRKLRKRVGEQVDIFGAEPSTYFTDIKPITGEPKMDTWENCLKRELQLAVTHPPANIYEELILWTDRGIFWKFPIDNEQGLEDEKQVSFEEHVFLESHLEGWCPEKGPIKHFMELVVTGLSKNFWMTAEEKKQHIFWYRDYFKDKNALLQEIGAGIIKDEENKIDSSNAKQS